ncbi:MAG: PAC2 family protein [Actinobacteria bacterium]|nr:PAC2 family protein [Actinomycetota bacterium]
MQQIDVVQLRKPVMIVAFTGWNDAGESASSLIQHLLAHWEHQLILEYDPEDYYDYQVNRPFIRSEENKEREIVWPTTRVFAALTPELPNDFLIVLGAEPSMRWQSFSAELLDIADDYEVDLTLLIGGLLADVPHSRPIQVNVTASHPDVAARFDVELSTYQGATGILGVISDLAFKRDINSVSLWAAVPHYVSTTPSPKATLALVEALEDFLEISLPEADLRNQSLEWEKSVDRMASEDAEVGEYVKELEKNKDESEIQEATGDSIAKELERFLRRQENS